VPSALVTMFAVVATLPCTATALAKGAITFASEFIDTAVGLVANVAPLLDTHIDSLEGVLQDVRLLARNTERVGLRVFRRQASGAG
jgi:hypothetical protein